MIDKAQRRIARKEMKNTASQLLEDMKLFVGIDELVTKLNIPRHPNAIRIANVLATKYNRAMDEADSIITVLESEVQ